MKNYLLEMKGISPLLMHADNIGHAGELDKWRRRPENKSKSVPGDDRSPAWTWMGYLYTDGTSVVMPTDNIRSCMMAAGAKVPAAKGRGSMKASAVSLILLDDIYAEFKIGGRVMELKELAKLSNEEDFEAHLTIIQKLGFELMVKRAQVGSNKHVRVRPMFREWSCSTTLTVLDDQITLDTLQSIFHVGGTLVGMCDWRPGAKKSPGPFGRYEAAIEEIV